MNGSPTLVQQLALAAALLLAYAAALLILRARGHLGRLQALGLQAALVVACGIPDALETLRGTWGDPAREGDPYVRAFLQWWGGWWGLCAALVLWVLGWALAFEGLEMLRLRLAGRHALAGAALAGFAQVYLLYALALGHLDGFSAWTHVPSLAYRASAGLLALLARDAPWTRPQATLGYALYPSLTYALLFAALHTGVAGVARRLAVALSAYDRSGPAAGALP